MYIPLFQYRVLAAIILCEIGYVPPFKNKSDLKLITNFIGCMLLNIVSYMIQKPYNFIVIFHISHSIFFYKTKEGLFF